MKRTRKFNNFKFIRPTGSYGFRDFKKQITENFKSKLFPAELQKELIKFSSEAYYKSQLKKAKLINYGSREISSIINYDYSLKLYNSLSFRDRRELIKDFEDDTIVSPIILFNRKGNTRWIIYGNEKIIYLVKILNIMKLTAAEIIINV